ncbi:MAG: DUF4388 domain-containing protein [Acidobacteria bacterium ACB2]|nr:DUF4388 domain-containing protein [Acidobacteria bacterium ACB2]
MVSAPRFEYRSDLAASPLAEVLQTVYHYKVPGLLSAVREGVEKKVYVWDGDVIFATSGDRRDSLGDYLLARERITQEQFDRSVELLLLAAGAKRHGDVLVDMGVLTEDELYRIVLAQVKEIVLSLFGWDEGVVAFTVGKYRTDELIQLSIPIRQMILEGVKSIANVPRLVELLGPSWTVFLPAYQAAEISDVGLSPAELRFLAQVDGVKSLKELVKSGPGDAWQNARLLYAFFVMKLIARRDLTSRGAVKKLQWKTTGGDYAPEGS